MEPVCTNAVLTRVARGGGSEDFDRAADAPDQELFAGSSGCWVDVETDNVVRYARVSDQLAHASILMDNVAELQVGDTVEFDFKDEHYERVLDRVVPQMFDGTCFGWQAWLEPA